MNYNQAQYQNSMNEYFNQTKKNRFKDNLKGIIILAIAVLHRLFAYPYLNDLLLKTLKDNNVNYTVIDYILMAYFLFSVLFIIIAGWKIVKDIRVINAVYFILALAYLGFFGYQYFITTKLYDDLTNKPKASFVIATKELANDAKTYWEKDTITGNSKNQTYIKSNGIYCNNKRLAITDDDISYLISVDYMGNIVEFKVTNGKFQYNYTGEALNVDDIISMKFTKVDDNNRIVIPACPN